MPRNREQRPPKLLWSVRFQTLLILCICVTGMLWHVCAPAQTIRSGLVSIVGINSAQCLNVDGDPTVATTGIIQRPCTAKANSLWTLVASGSGNYRLKAHRSGQCLTVLDSSNTPGAQLIQNPCQTTQTNDQWKVIARGNAFQIVSAANGMCVNVAAASVDARAKIIQFACQTPNGATSTNDQFLFNPYLNTDPATSIVSLSSGLCMNVYQGMNTSTGIVQSPCDGNNNNSWMLAPVGANYHVVARSSGMCLNVPGGTQAPGEPLIQFPCQAAAQTNDQWRLQQFGQGYRIVSVLTNQCAHIEANSNAINGRVVQWPCQDAATLSDQFILDLPKQATRTLPSNWTPIIPLAVTPVGLSNLPNGKLMMWTSDKLFSFAGDVGNAPTQTYTSLFDPASLQSTPPQTATAGADMFCSGTTMLPNGTLLVNGGDSSPRTTLYDWTTNDWSAAANMQVPRGYHANTLLSNGSVFTLGGSWSGGSGNKSGEVWTSTGGWRLLSGVPAANVTATDPQDALLGRVFRGDNHLWLFAQSHGAVFHAGPSARMNWITTAGNGSITSAGNRGNDEYSMNGNAVMYAPGKILKLGGAPTYQQNGSIITYAKNTAHLIDISGGSGQPVQVRQLADMAYRRAFANAVILPNGSVVVVGGQSIPMPFSDGSAVLTPEIWNPSTQQFNLLRPMNAPRTYHSTALLLPDGRVFVGGGGLCGKGCAQNHPTGQILTPPYLLNPDGTAATRPVIQSVPATAARGSTITATTDSAVSWFSLMRLSATTHTVNNDQRRIPLHFTKISGTSYALRIPADSGDVLPGYYMLFAMSATDVPSVSAIVQVQ